MGPLTWVGAPLTFPKTFCPIGTSLGPLTWMDAPFSKSLSHRDTYIQKCIVPLRNHWAHWHKWMCQLFQNVCPVVTGLGPLERLKEHPFISKLLSQWDIIVLIDMKGCSFNFFKVTAPLGIGTSLGPLTLKGCSNFFTVIVPLWHQADDILSTFGKFVALYLFVLVTCFAKKTVTFAYKHYLGIEQDIKDPCTVYPRYKRTKKMETHA